MFTSGKENLINNQNSPKSNVLLVGGITRQTVKDMTMRRCSEAHCHRGRKKQKSFGTG